ncbi:MAG: hypothetical protein FWE01_00110 [Firmicutes bacterium]|nr:hypothetical protein [Bacillota bacterium]
MDVLEIVLLIFSVVHVVAVDAETTAETTMNVALSQDHVKSVAGNFAVVK